MGQPELSVVVPAYNEAAGIVATLRALLAELERTGLAHEVLVVDNASTDGTPDAVDALGDPRVRVLRNPRDLGKGASMRRGMLEARGALRLHCDADCGSSLPALPAHARAGRGRPTWSSARGSRPVPPSAAASRFAAGSPAAPSSASAALVLREPTRDLFCGFKLWRAEAAEAAFRASRLDGWVFDAETLAMARALGFRIAEVGIPWEDRAGSRLSMPRVMVPVTRDLLAARRRVSAVARAPVPLVEPRVAEAAERQG